MERIWAPWRMPYISNAVSDDGCIFCNARDAADDREKLVLLRGTQHLLMLNRFPYVNGHLMVAPFRHGGSLQELNGAELLDLMEGVRAAQDLLERAVRPDGFNIGINIGKAAGGGVVDHLHVHVVPRWNGDSNFMTVIGDVRVIPEGLMACYDRLAALLGERE